MLGLVIAAFSQRKFPSIYRMFEQFSGIPALAFAQSRHRHPQNLQLMQRDLTLVFPTMRSLALSLRTIVSPFKFTPHIVRYTLKRLQLFMPAKFS